MLPPAGRPHGNCRCERRRTVRFGAALQRSLVRPAGARGVGDFPLAPPGRVEGLVVVGPSVSGYVPATMPDGFDAVVQAVRAGDLRRAAAAMAAMPAMGVGSAVQRRSFVE